MNSPRRAIPAVLTVLLTAYLLLPAPARADPTEGAEFGPQFRTATWSFDNAANYTTVNAAVSGGAATLQPTGSQLVWTTGTDFLLNRSSSTNVTFEPGHLRLAGNPNELVANGDFNGPASWSFVSSPNFTASNPLTYGRFDGTVGRAAQTFDRMESTADWVENGPGASISADSDRYEGSASVNVTWNPVLPTQFGGALRTIGGPWAFTGWTGLRLWTNTSESGAEVYVELADVLFATWDSPPQPVANGWGPHEFDFTAATIDLSQVLSVEVRFTNLSGGTRSAKVDFIEWYKRTPLNETAAIHQTVSKPNPTRPEPSQSELRFDLNALATGNVTARLDVAVANVSDMYRTSIPLVAPFSGTIVRDPSLNLTAAGDYNVSFAVHVDADTTGVAQVFVGIDGVSLVAPGYANGSFLSTVVDLLGEVSFDTVAANATLGPGLDLAILARSGPTPAVDGSWSSWSAHAPGAEPASMPPNRYAQFVLWLNTSDGLTTPTLEDLTLTFKTYALSGTVTTEAYAPAEAVFLWHNLTWAASTPGGTTAAFEYSLNGIVWIPTLGGIGATGTPSIWIRALLGSPSSGRTPVVFDVTLHFEVYGALDLIVVSPPSVNLTADQTFEFTATAYDQWGHELTTFGCDWDENDPAPTGTVTGDGTRTGNYSAGAVGGPYRVYCFGANRTKWDFAFVNVTAPGPLAAIEVCPDPRGGCLPPAIPVATTQPLLAEGKDADGNGVSLAGTVWSTTIGQLRAPLDATHATLAAPTTTGTGRVTACAGAICGGLDVAITSFGTPRINGTVLDVVRPEDSGPYVWDLRRHAENQPDPANDTLANLKWYLTGKDDTLYRVWGEDTFGRHDLVITPRANASGDDNVVLWLEDRNRVRTSQSSLRIRITPINDPPYWFQRPQVFVRAGAAYTLDLGPYVADVDDPDTSLTITTDDPAHVSVSGLLATYRYPAGSPPDLYVRHWVRDASRSALEYVRIRVASNPPPFGVEPLPDLDDLIEDVPRSNAFPLSLDAYFDDLEGELFFLAWNFADLVVDVWTRANGYVQVNVTGRPDFCGIDRITFRATDARGAWIESTVPVTVACVNDPPVLSWTEDVPVRFDAPYRLDLSPFVDDVDSPRESLVLATDHPAAAAERLAVTFLYARYDLEQRFPPPKPSYVVPVNLTASDGANQTTVAINVVVGDNRPPELIVPFDDLEIDEDSRPPPIDLDGHFSDLPVEPLAFNASAVGGRIVPRVAAGDLTLVPEENWSGPEVIVVRATDSDGAFAITSFLVAVRPVNDPPVLRAIPAQVRDGGGTWFLDLRPYVSDVDNIFAELALSANSGSVRIVGSVAVFSYPNVDFAGRILITVRDPGNLTASASVTVDVNGPSIWSALWWPWSGFGILAIAALAYVAWGRLAERRYSFEDLFLVGREGRLIMHTTRRLRADQDPDILTGMLTAIMLFVRDSFKEEKEDLKRFEFGDRLVTLERSEHTVAAAIFSGEVPHGVSLHLRQFLTDVEDRYEVPLAKWSGDADDLPGLRAMMQDFGRRGKWRVGDWKRLSS